MSCQHVSLSMLRFTFEFILRLGEMDESVQCGPRAGKIRHYLALPPRSDDMERRSGPRNDPIDRFRTFIDGLTFLQLTVILTMIADELNWRFRAYEWTEVQPSAATPPRPPRAEDADPAVNDGSTVSGSASEPEEEHPEEPEAAPEVEVPAPRRPQQPPGPPPGWRGGPPWKRRRQ